ncbi:MAG: hypothetical protein V4805_16930 [Pseudomonadota bacterium]
MFKTDSSILKFIWLALAIITLAAIVLIGNYSPYIPDYDGLTYFNNAKIINSWLFNHTDFKLKNGDAYVMLWPITNALSVIIAAVFFRVIDNNLLPTLINSLYIFLFATYLTKIRSATYAYIVTLLLCSHALFFRLFTTLTSEFSVGLWIFAFLLTLVSNHQRREVYLAALAIFGLLLRTVDIVFILSATTAYSAIHYSLWRDKQHVFKTLRYIGLVLILTTPIFFEHYKVAFEYIYSASFGRTAAVWKAMAGVTDRFDVTRNYGKFLFLYNPMAIPATVLLVVFSLFAKAISNKQVAIIIGIAFSVCFPLLAASSLNIQTVFWIFSALAFISFELGRQILSNEFSIIRKFNKIRALQGNTFFIVISIFCMFFLHRSWRIEVPYLKQQKDLSEISFEISSVLNKAPGTPTIASNFHGMGALDVRGLSWKNASNFSYGGVADIYSKNMNSADYLLFDSSINFFITAHENYFFPTHFGINDRIKETHELFSDRSNVLGFRKITEISKKGRIFDIWYRPNIQYYLQYASFGDNWISSKLPLEIGTKELCAEKLVTGKLYFSADFQNPNLQNYPPPFSLSIQNRISKSIISSSIVNSFGKAEIVFDIRNIPCGEYELTIDKTFSTDKDSRKLSALFLKLDSALKFDSNLEVISK